VATSWAPAGNLRGPQGNPGAKGDTGNTGAPGADGAAGAQGLGVLSGNGAPGNGVGRDGEFYIARDLGRLYGPKTSGAWPAAYVVLNTGPLASELRSGTVAASLTSNAADGGNGRPANIVDLTVTGNITINPPTNPTNGQVMRYRCVAQGAQRTVTLASGFVSSSGLTLGPYTIPQGRVLIFTIEYVGIRTTSAGVAAAAWVLTAATTTG
jgi:hypothetical protein